MDSKPIQTAVEHLYRELEQLKASSANKKVEIRLLRTRIDETVRQHDGLNAEVKRISTEAKKLREKRDSLNAKVKELKTKRDELRSKALKKRETLSKLLEQACVKSLSNCKVVCRTFRSRLSAWIGTYRQILFPRRLNGTW